MKIERVIQVVERGEWVPAVRAPMVKDVSTGTRIGVVYVMIPMTSEDEDGAVVRIMSSKEPGAYYSQIRLMYRNIMVVKEFHHLALATPYRIKLREKNVLYVRVTVYLVHTHTHTHMYTILKE